MYFIPDKVGKQKTAYPTLYFLALVFFAEDSDQGYFSDNN